MEFIEARGGEKKGRKRGWAAGCIWKGCTTWSGSRRKRKWLEKREVEGQEEEEEVEVVDTRVVVARRGRVTCGKSRRSVEEACGGESDDAAGALQPRTDRERTGGPTVGLR